MIWPEDDIQAEITFFAFTPFEILFMFNIVLKWLKL